MAEKCIEDGNAAVRTELNGPKKILGLSDAVALIVGIVIGAGIFRTPSLAAANSSSEGMFFGVWIAGGLISLIGALCYAELAGAFPSTGGDYHFIQRAFGRKLSFLFAWARMTVIQTGSIALLAFIFGDYTAEILNAGPYSSVFYAALIVVILTAINIAGIKLGSGAQKLLTILEVAGVLLITAAGLFSGSSETSHIPPVSDGASGSSLGMAMVIVLLTFGGWNEAAYLSAELRSGSRQLVKALVIGLLIITAVYLAVNFAFLKSLGLQGMADSTAVGTDVMRQAMGQPGVLLIGGLVAISALTSANATIFTGARTNYALGRDFKSLRRLGIWNEKRSAPVNAFIVQGLISLALISMGFFTRSGFETIVDYTAPVFWFFLLLAGISLFVLRIKEPNADRPFRVPLYPITPLIFCLTSSYLLCSSIVYTGIGALAGLVVLLIGLIVLFFVNQSSKKNNITKLETL